MHGIGRCAYGRLPRHHLDGAGGHWASTGGHEGEWLMRNQARCADGVSPLLFCSRPAAGIQIHNTKVCLHLCQRCAAGRRLPRARARGPMYLGHITSLSLGPSRTAHAHLAPKSGAMRCNPRHLPCRRWRPCSEPCSVMYNLVRAPSGSSCQLAPIPAGFAAHAHRSCRGCLHVR